MPVHRKREESRWRFSQTTSMLVEYGTFFNHAQCKLPIASPIKPSYWRVRETSVACSPIQIYTLILVNLVLEVLHMVLHKRYEGFAIAVCWFKKNIRSMYSWSEFCLCGYFSTTIIADLELNWCFSSNSGNADAHSLIMQFEQLSLRFRVYYVQMYRVEVRNGFMSFL